MDQRAHLGSRDVPSATTDALPERAVNLPIPTLNALLTGDPDQFVAKYTDIAAVNLACARGLPNCDESEFPKYLALLDTIAEAVRRQTDKNFRLFKLKPKQFSNSENVFRLYTMEHVFRVQFGIRYDPLIREVAKRGARRKSSDSTEVFIHGILGEKRTGTCSSLPTFAIAVGRQLGYPLKLILVPNHTLYRWDDGSEVFNLQPTQAGGEVKPDEYYHGWPVKWDASLFAFNERTKVWLRPLTPRQEVSKFLCNRALMLRDAGRRDDALQALDAAERFDPVNPACTEIRLNILEQSGESLFTATSAPELFYNPGPTPMRVEAGGDPLLNMLDPYRDRTEGPAHSHVRIMPMTDGQSPMPQIIIRPKLRETER